MTRPLYALWLFGWVFSVACIIAMFTFIGFGIVKEGGETEPWGEFAGLFLAIGIVTLLANGFWTDYMVHSKEMSIKPAPKVKLNREDRKKLRAEQSRIHLERSIAEAEKEAFGA